jgi:hypothetical protein
MIDSRAKGARGELKVRDILRELTGLKWERTPGSGAYSQSHGLKGDVYVPGTTNIFTVEVKSYEEDQLTSKIFNPSSKFMEWIEQAWRQAEQNGNLPLLIFKYDRSKIFAAYPPGVWEEAQRDRDGIYVKIKGYQFWVSPLEDWIKYGKPEFVK